MLTDSGERNWDNDPARLFGMAMSSRGHETKRVSILMRVRAHPVSRTKVVLDKDDTPKLSVRNLLQR